MSKFNSILSFVWHIILILTGFAIACHGLYNKDYAELGVGLILMTLPDIDRIHKVIVEDTH